MELEKIIEKAKSFFNKHQDVDVLVATTDGNLFLVKDKSHAKSHAKENDLELRVIDRTSVCEGVDDDCNEDVDAPDLLSMGKEQLIDFALENDIEVEEDWTEQEMIAEITKELTKED